VNFRTLLIALASLTWVITGCSKQSPEATAAQPRIHDLGVVNLTNGIMTQHDLGGGRVCIVTPTVQADGTLLLAMRIEEDGKLLSAPRVITKPDQACEISVGDIGIGLTPHIKQ